MHMYKNIQRSFIVILATIPITTTIIATSIIIIIGPQSYHWHCQNSTITTNTYKNSSPHNHLATVTIATINITIIKGVNTSC